MTRRWWAPVRDALAEQGLERPPDLLRLLEHALPGRTSSPASRASARTSSSQFVETLPEDDILRDELERFRDGRSRGLVGELPLLRRARLYFDARGPEGRDGAAAPEAERRRRRTSAARRRCACRRRSSRSTRLDPRAARPAAGRRSTPSALAAPRRGDRQHRVSARPRRLQHPARDRRGQRRRCAASTCSARRRR